MGEMRGKAKKKKEGKEEKGERRRKGRIKELSGIVSPGKISYSYANAKMCAIIHKKASASGAQRPTHPFPGLCPWTPLQKTSVFQTPLLHAP